jgi:ATP-dependent RNA helicase DeaD
MTKSFAALGLSDLSLEAISKKGFEEPTEIQAKVIPLLLGADSDVIAQAQTGTGKTAAFGLVFVDKLIAGKHKSPQAIVLAPTRELAVQVADEMSSLKGNNNLSIIPIYGGQSWGMQRKHLNAGVDIVVGTPGRVLDHLKKGTLKLDQIQYCVLDEADEMLNMGFVEDIEAILEFTNQERQTLLFSATMPPRIANLAKKYMQSPVSIKTEQDRIANNAVDQIYFEVTQANKFDTLCRIIDMEEDFYGIVFCRTKISSDEVNQHLNQRGYRSETFHGDISQDRREQIMGDFRKKKLEILVATDVAARGIDVSDLTHVINYALPQDSESYVHRIGRTGRAGKEGKAITLITPSEYRKLRMFEQRAKADIQKQFVPDATAMVDLKKRKIMRDIEPLLEPSDDLKKYEALATSMFTDQEPQAVIAALLKYSFSDTLDENAYKNIVALSSDQHSGGGRGRERDRGRGGRDRTERGGDHSHDRDRRQRRERASGGMGITRLFLTTGRADGATIPSILQMIEKDFGVSGKLVGDIDIMNDYSFISVPFPEAETILDAFHAMKKKRRPPVRVERVAKDKRNGGGSRKERSKAKNKGKKKKGKSNSDGRRR